MNRIIGITGLAGSGKDTFYKLVCAGLDFDRIALADPLKALVFSRGQNAQYLESPQHYYEFFGVEKSPETRTALQLIGTEYYRDRIDPCFWIDIALSEIRRRAARGAVSIAITDVRFEDEAQAIRGNEAWMRQFYAKRRAELKNTQRDIEWRMTHTWNEQHPHYGHGCLPPIGTFATIIRIERFHLQIGAAHSHASEIQRFDVDDIVYNHSLAYLKGQGIQVLRRQLPLLDLELDILGTPS